MVIRVSLCVEEVHSSLQPFSQLGHHLVKASKLRKRTFLESRLKENESIKVGIIGAGISGLYAATLLQHLGIDYEILEASGRIGGRVRTHYFGKNSESDYAELRAMRLPKMKEYNRLIGKQNWSLVSYLNRNLEPRNQIKLIEFFDEHKNNVFYFNNIRKYRFEVERSTHDLFGFGKSSGGYIDDEYPKKSERFWKNKAADYINKLFDASFSCRVKKLSKNDFKTFRSWLLDPGNEDFVYPYDVVDSMEMFVPETRYYSYSMLDVNFSNLLFKYTNFTIEGGFSKLIRAMVSLLKKKPKLHQKVTRLRQSDNKKLIITTDRDNLEYTHVIATPLLTVLGDVNFDLEMQIKKRVAMRVLNYQFAVKVAFLFKTRFWENETIMRGRPIFGGATITDLNIRQVIYPSHAINCSNCRGALLVSYALANDAKKFLIFSKFQIVKKCLKDLSVTHGPEVCDQFTGKYAMMDSTKNQFTQGAYGLFAPGQTASFYVAPIYPEASGRLFFAGDTSSLIRGWTIGAVIAGYRSVKDILSTQGKVDKVKQLEERWGNIEEPTFNHIE